MDNEVFLFLIQLWPWTKVNVIHNDIKMQDIAIFIIILTSKEIGM